VLAGRGNLNGGGGHLVFLTDNLPDAPVVDQAESNHQQNDKAEGPGNLLGDGQLSQIHPLPSSKNIWYSLLLLPKPPEDNYHCGCEAM